MKNARSFLRPALAVLVIAMMGFAAFSGCLGKPVTQMPAMNINAVTPDDLAALKSVGTARSGSVPEDSVVIASSDDPFYALIATPIAAYYEGGALKKVPLLVSNAGNTYPWIHTVPSIATEPTVFSDMGPVVKFLQAYNPGSAIMVGMDKISYTGAETQAGQLTTVSYELKATTSFTGNITDIAIKAAETYWSRAEAAVLVEADDTGYAEALGASAIASYLNIPVIPVSDVGTNVVDTLSKLGVKYTIVCGDVKFSSAVSGMMGKFGKLMRFFSADAMTEGTLSLAPKAEGDIPYIVLANPLDTYVPKVLNETVTGIAGELTDVGIGNTAPYPGMPETGASVPFNFTIPADYSYTNVMVNITFDLTPLTTSLTPLNADFYNTRFLINVFRVDEGAKTLVFMANAVCYDYVRDAAGKPTAIWMQTEFEVVNQPGSYEIAVGPLVGASLIASTPVEPATLQFAGTVTLQKLDAPVYPLMPRLSSMAPYLAAIHKGVVLAKPDFALRVAGLGGCVDCGEPSADADSMIDANKKALAVHAEVVALLEKIYGLDDPQKLNDKLNEDLTKAPYLAILADPNMVPMYYYTGGVGAGAGEGGQGQPGDLLYSSVNPDLANIDIEDPNTALYDVGGNVMSAEVAVTRITGYDVQDASALIARSNFYDRYLAGYTGPKNVGGGTQQGTGFGYTAYNGLGSLPPIEGAITTAEQMDGMESLAGFNVVTPTKGEKTGRDATGIQWESSSFIWMVVHGFWYHFVPDAVMGAVSGPTSPYAVKHVKYMTMGPSFMQIESCITARTDGLKAYNTISQAFLHAGANAYFGGTRSMWGTITPELDNVEKLGSYMVKWNIAHLTGYWISDSGTPGPVAPANLDVGHAMLYTRNHYIQDTGLSNSNQIDTISVTVVYADPAWNPYEPNHEGGMPSP